LVRLIVFDLDGTLVDSRRDLAESANAVLTEYGCRPLAEDAIGRMVGDGAATLVARAFAAAGCVQPRDALRRFLDVYNARLLRFTRVYPGIAETLAAVEGRAHLAVLTNKPIGPARAILAGLDLAHHFPVDSVIGGDGPFPRKPDPAGLHALARKIGVAPGETLMVGDSTIDWRTARAAGARACLARYGFGFETFPLEMLGSEDQVIGEPEELLAVLY
jgi:phosphoglycolate phosphatase